MQAHRYVFYPRAKILFGFPTSHFRNNTDDDEVQSEAGREELGADHNPER